MADAPVKKEEHLPARPAATATPPDVASDPDEDDLSDLDDVLDDFENTKLDSKAPPTTTKPESSAAPSSSGPGRPEDLSPAELLLENEDEFAKQLQREMEQLLGNGDFGKQFEDIMKEMGEEMGGVNPLAALGVEPPSTAKDTSTPKAKEPSQPEPSSSKTEKSFQETIKKTMERMQSSGDAAGAAASSSGESDMLAQMLAAMGDSGGLGGAEGNDEDFSKILMGMMEQLTNREILYEPMKELNDKFPKWMEDHKGKVDSADMKRYEEQQVLVREITGRFERKGYSDGDAGDREYIVERMQKMQAAGSPPPDLVGDMNAAQEVMQDMDQGCPTQ